MPENTPKASAAKTALSRHVWAGFVRCGHAPVPWNPGFWREVHCGR